MTTAVTPDLDRLAIDTIRTLSIDGVQQANSGHPGAPMGAAPMAYVALDALPPPRPDPPGMARSRPVRAVGRARLDAAVLAAPPDRLRPPARRAQGVPSVGLADAGPPGARPDAGRRGDDRVRSARASPTRSAWPSPSAVSAPSSTGDGGTIVDHRTYVIASDGDLQEGIASEACQPRRPPAPRQAHRAVRRQRHPARRPDGDGLVGGSSRSASRPTAGTPSGSLTATTSPPSSRRSRRPRRRRSAEPHRRPHPHRLRQPEQAGLAEGARRAARSRRGPPDQGGLRLGPGQDVLRAGRGAGASSARRVDRPASGSSPSGTSRWRGYGDARRRRAPRSSCGASPVGCGRRLGRRPQDLRGRRGDRHPERVAGRHPGAGRARPRAVRRGGRPVRVEPDRRQGRGRTSAPTSPGATCASASASTPWAGSPTASPTTADSSRTTPRS